MSTNPDRESESWESSFKRLLPLYGHRNWIVVADSAYPAQSNPGIETVFTGGDHTEVLKKVLDAIGASIHVRTNVYLDAELKQVAEEDAPGVSALRKEMIQQLAGNNTHELAHEGIIARLDRAGKLFRILILKSMLAIPYSSVFLELDCGYWSEEAEERLRRVQPDKTAAALYSGESRRGCAARYYEAKKDRQTMQRREFCKLIAAAAAAGAIPANGQSAAGPTAGFNKLHRTYEEFCATPESERTFYSLVDGKIVEKKLNTADWSATAWGEAPELPGGSWDGVPMQAPVEGQNGDGPYQANWESLLQYEAPEWYRDAKFGIWAHWSPQCVPEFGDWYARNMYEEGSPDYNFQNSHYGHPSEFGYKDLCAQWTLLNWEPEALIERYRSAGARLFIALANHHDGFDAWGSKHQPWNSVNHGPHRDVVGEWAAAARRQGMRFGVTVHQARNWWWFQTAHGVDKSGRFTGVGYDGRMTRAEGKGQWWDGLDPQMLYGPKHPKDALPDASYVKNFYDRTRDLIDQHNPDLLYFDNALLPLGWGGMNVGAYFYNHNLKTHGKMEAVLNVKNVPDKLAKAVVADYERGLTSGIMPYAWQSETCIGEWHYRRSLFEGPGAFGSYLPPRDAIHWLVDTVSKNGTFILNIPGKPDGTIDSKEAAVLDEIAEWLKVNGEAIFDTRPWTVYGEGPNSVTGGPFQGASISAMGSKDIRFTRNKANNVVYAIFMGWPERKAQITSFGLSSKANPGKVQNVTVVGSDAKVTWTQEADALHVQLPFGLPIANSYGAAVKIALS